MGAQAEAAAAQRLADDLRALADVVAPRRVAAPDSAPQGLPDLLPQGMEVAAHWPELLARWAALLTRWAALLVH